jgi:hypothetical protein
MECQSGSEVDTCVDGTPTEDPEATCDDGIDNDCDGNIDDADEDCECFPSERTPQGSCTQTWNPDDCCSKLCGRYSSYWSDNYCIDDLSDLGPGSCDNGRGVAYAHNVVSTADVVCCDGEFLPSGSTCDCTTPGVDFDEDGITDCNDNCDEDYNPTQTDCDNDGIGDACDVDTIDTDGDGVDNECDNCEFRCNANQSDADSDGIGDVCDETPGCGGCGGGGSCETLCSL